MEHLIYKFKSNDHGIIKPEEIIYPDGSSVSYDDEANKIDFSNCSNYIGSPIQIYDNDVDQGMFELLEHGINDEGVSFIRYGREPEPVVELMQKEE